MSRMTAQERRLCSLNYRNNDFVKQNVKDRKLDRQNGMLLPIVVVLWVVAWVLIVEIF